MNVEPIEDADFHIIFFLFNKSILNNSQNQSSTRQNSNQSTYSNINSCNLIQPKKQTLFEKLNHEKCEVISTLQLLKQKILEIEMRQNEAIRQVSCFFYKRFLQILIYSI